VNLIKLRFTIEQFLFNIFELKFLVLHSCIKGCARIYDYEQKRLMIPQVPQSPSQPLPSHKDATPNSYVIMILILSLLLSTLQY
jgi:hypothetical protein